MNGQLPPNDDFGLQPVDCPSREQWERTIERKELPPPEPPAAPKFQFSMIDLFALTVGCSVGFAGGTWMPVVIYAAALGLTILWGMLLVPLLTRLPEVALRRIGLIMLSAYAASILAVALRS